MAEGELRAMRFLIRFFGFLFAFGSLIFLIAIGAISGLLYHFSQDLPDYSTLQNYEPPVMTRVHATDGQLLAEYAHERRLYLPIQAVPKLIINAFISAEDKNFYEHAGLDFGGVARAGMLYVQNMGTGRRPQGASTITQQVAKNMLLTPERSFSRKIKEALLALKIERTYSKDKILELYLNQIYLGFSSYGVAAAALLYFDKSVHELTVAEAAYLAALPKAPTTLHPFRQHDRAVERRNWVIDRMVENGYVAAAVGEKAKKDPLTITQRPTGAHIIAADYFAEDVRREILEKYGETKLYEGGLSVRATLDPKMQVIAHKALSDGLVRYDEGQGFRGPITKIDISGDWGIKLADVRAFADIVPWRLAVVLETNDQSARIGLQPGREPGGAVLRDRLIGNIPLDGVKWVRASTAKNPIKVGTVVAPGDVVYVEPLGKDSNQYKLRQIPEVSGGMAVMDPLTGRVLALVGGFSFDQSQFDRSTQALRQPGSSFKPFVYSAALDNGYTPSSIVLDAPIEIDQGPGIGIWRPENYANGKYAGPATLRFGIEQSRNLMTVRLAQDIGMPLIADYAKRFGIYDNLPNYLSYSLGAGETTVLRMVTAYSMLANGGRRVTPTLIDRVQDRYGHTIYKHDERECPTCDAKRWENQPEPSLGLGEQRERVLDAMTAYQITSIMEGVIQRGTATVVKEVGKPIAGKTGTTNDEKDAWFVGFTPDLVVGVYMGYDKPRHLGRNATGGHLAAPIARDFFKAALADKPAMPFQPPRGIKLIRVDSKTGQRAGPGTTSVLLEAFKPGTAPPDNNAIAGIAGQEGASYGVSPEADRAVRSGGGLY
jgi:penicillin-binding protein 1A